MSTAVEAPPDVSKLSLEELFEEMKKLPDWNRFPMPEVFYEKFQVKKPQPQTVQESCSFNPYVYMHFGQTPVEVRGPVEGGVREIKELMSLPVEVKRINEETGELEDYPPPDPMIGKRIEDLATQSPWAMAAKWSSEFFQKLKDQTADDRTQCLTTDSLNCPKEDNTKESQPESGPQ